MEVLEGTLEQIVYQSETDGFMVARFTPSAHPDQRITIVGNIAAVSPGENLVLKGKWSVHPKYGRQFDIEEYQTVLPATAAGIQKYLASGLIKGIGTVLSSRIIECFGVDTLRIIGETPERLLEVNGIGPHKLQRITQAWIEQKEIRDVMLFLKAHDVSTGYAVKIFKTYGREAIRVVKANPYQLAEDIFGIGFTTADRIAMKLGVTRDAPERIRAALLYTLSEAAGEGHVYLPRSKLIHRCTELLSLESDQSATAIDQAIQQLRLQELLIMEQGETDEPDGQGEAVYLPPFYHAELGVASRLKLIRSTPPRIAPQQAEKKLHQLKQKATDVGYTYSPEQEEAIRVALLTKVMILTGGPGTGKTTTVKGIIKAMEWLNWVVLLAAPTGRAAKRLSEATGREAMTIHRLLGYRPPYEFQFHEENPLEADAVIIDELSMIDLILMNNLLKAIPSQANLILVGDADQLPSVGAGYVLHDLIASEEFHVIQLRKIFRQAQQSRIVVNAHRVNQGQFPYLQATDQENFFFIEEDDPEQVAELIGELVSQRLPKHYGFDPFRDIQVLSPMYRGAIGADHLNLLLQERLNSKEAFNFPGASRRFRLGDKVMQIRNNYKKEVFNGDIGRMVDVDEINQQIRVEFPDRGLVLYEAADLHELVLAYAITIHKSQGSEYKAVVMPIHTHHYVMLQRNLLYTGITRARELVVLVGSKKALGIAVHNDKPQLRYSRLATRLAKQ